MKFLAAIHALAAGVAHADFFRNDFLPVGHVRTDAIINPDCLSDHVHTFYGPPLLYPKVTFEDLRNSDPTMSSGNIEENLSLYWHPAVYHVAADGKKTLQESEMTTVYYNWIPGQTTAFPPGFRMITPGEDVFDEGITSGASEMELSISFPSCWNGALDSPDHMSHVAFPEGERLNSPCPPTHPVRIPRLDFFIRWFDTNAAKWEFADGSTRFHADYVSGWDESFLQSILNGGDGDVDSRVTFRAGIVHQGEDSELVQQLNDNAVPKADTSCIATETIDNVINLPSGACTGTLISPFGVCGGPAPTTPAPTAPAPTTPTPTDPAPTTPTPTAPVPTTPTPTAPVPTTPTPTAPTPTTPTPTAPTPTTPTPTAPAPTTPTPTAPAPTTPTPTAPTPTTPTPTASTPTTSTPTSPAPTTSTPTAPVQCQDSWFEFRLTINGRNRWKDCTWASDRASTYRCGLDGAVETMCPETCGTCHECFDSADVFRFDYFGDFVTKDCDWVANDQTRCQLDGVALACRFTCGLC